jgi:putative SOS response-associated peptidase YedK
MTPLLGLSSECSWTSASKRWSRAGGGLIALAGLWENWRSAGEWVRSFAIITTRPNNLYAELHDRMPVVLKPDIWRLWLREDPAAPS